MITPCPCDLDGWKLYSFSTRHINFKEPWDAGLGPRDEQGEPTITRVSLRHRLKVGTAFLLSYFEHGDGIWFLRGERSPGMAGDFRWDGVDMAGLLIWKWPVRDLGPRTYEARADDARAFLRRYTNWANGYEDAD